LKLVTLYLYVAQVDRCLTSGYFENEANHTLHFIFYTRCTMVILNLSSAD